MSSDTLHDLFLAGKDAIKAGCPASPYSLLLNLKPGVAPPTTEHTFTFACNCPCSSHGMIPSRSHILCSISTHSASTVPSPSHELRTLYSICLALTPIAHTAPGPGIACGSSASILPALLRDLWTSSGQVSYHLCACCSAASNPTVTSHGHPSCSDPFVQIIFI